MQLQVKHREFTSESELIDHYKAVKRRAKAWTKKPPEVAMVTHSCVAEVIELSTLLRPELEALLWEPKAKIKPTPAWPSIRSIMVEVASHYHVTPLDILSGRCTRHIVRPRQVAMYLSRTLTLNSMPEIGRRLGGRDHTTVLHGVRKITALLESGSDPELADDINVLTEILSPKFPHPPSCAITDASSGDPALTRDERKMPF